MPVKFACLFVCFFGFCIICHFFFSPVTLPLGNPGVPKSIPIVFANGTAAGCVPAAGETYENAAAAAAGAVAVGAKEAKKAGPKKLVNKLVNKQAGAAVPPRSASASSLVQPGPLSPAVSRPLPPPVVASGVASPVPPRSNQVPAKVPPPPDRANKIPPPSEPAPDILVNKK